MNGLDKDTLERLAALHQPTTVYVEGMPTQVPPPQVTDVEARKLAEQGSRDVEAWARNHAAAAPEYVVAEGPAQAALAAAEKALAAHERTVPAADAIEAWAAEHARLQSLVVAHQKRATFEATQFAQQHADNQYQARMAAIEELKRAYDRWFLARQVAKAAIEQADLALRDILDTETQKVNKLEAEARNLEAQALALGAQNLPERPQSLVAELRTVGRGIWL